MNKFDETSRTPLIRAVEKEYLEIARILIKAGADVNACDQPRFGNTALRQIAEVESYEIIELLVKAGANPIVPGWMQITALDIARKQANENSSKRSKQEDYNILELLEKTTEQYAYKII